MSLLRNTLIAIVLAGTSAAGSGCGPAHVQVVAASPRLVWVAPGVWVVEDYPWAVYYADGYYWRHIDGVWFRSTWYDEGFARWDIGLVPRIVIRHHRPSYYVHYRARPGTRVRVIDHRTRRPVVREHRTRPVIRDHRR